MPPRFVTKYGIFYPGEDKPRGELFDFMASAAMHLLSSGAYAMKAVIKPVSVPEKGEIKNDKHSA